SEYIDHKLFLGGPYDSVCMPLALAHSSKSRNHNHEAIERYAAVVCRPPAFRDHSSGSSAKALTGHFRWAQAGRVAIHDYATAE
ncbi:MAG TPA: hypothetical protein VLU47_09785, partial [Blastocatellia bacterium]|nr:hypothetical protein [Blastocatellia bacterium]